MTAMLQKIADVLGMSVEDMKMRKTATPAIQPPTFEALGDKLVNMTLALPHEQLVRRLGYMIPRKDPSSPPYAKTLAECCKKTTQEKIDSQSPMTDDQIYWFKNQLLSDEFGRLLIVGPTAVKDLFWKPAVVPSSA